MAPRDVVTPCQRPRVGWRLFGPGPNNLRAHDPTPGLAAQEQGPAARAQGVGHPSSGGVGRPWSHLGQHVAPSLRVLIVQVRHVSEQARHRLDGDGSVVMGRAPSSRSRGRPNRWGSLGPVEQVAEPVDDWLICWSPSGVGFSTAPSGVVRHRLGPALRAARERGVEEVVRLVAVDDSVWAEGRGLLRCFACYGSLGQGAGRW